MPVDTSTVGAEWTPLELELDARRLMAYAAGIDDRRTDLYDTTRPGGVVVHPVFPVAPEWQLLTEGSTPLRDVTAEETARGVHATHDLWLHRPIRQGDRITLGAKVVGVQRTRAGALRTIRFEARDATGAAVWTTYLGGINRGVETVGDDRVDDDIPAAPLPLDGAYALEERTLPVGALDALVYTECARIWNPIHTDVAVARRAGLPDPILHGTATLARAVTTVLEMVGARHEDVTRIAGRFRAMVMPASEMTVQLAARNSRDTRFVVRNAAGELALADGLLRV